MADEVVESKPFWASKTLWLNIIGIAWVVGAKPLGLPTLSPEIEMGILGALNVILRFITKSEITIS